MPLLRCFPVALMLCSACALAQVQTDAPVTSVTPTTQTAKQNDGNAFRRQADPERYQYEALSPNNAALLLRRVDVQHELRITEKQNMLLGPVLENAFKGALNQNGLEQLAGILSSRQMQRFRELDYQWHGPFLLYQPDVAKQVGLTADQNLECSHIYTQLVTSTKDASGGLRKISQAYDEKYPPQQGPLPAEAKARMQQEIAAEYVKIYQQMAADILKAETQLLSSLNPSQKTQWKKLLGKSFVFQTQNSK